MSRMPKASKTLVLYLDGDRITASEFTTAVDAFFEMVREVAREATGKTNAIDWIANVESGSIGLSATAEARTPSVDAARVANVVYSGIKTLGFKKTQQTGKRPAFFSDKALQRAREIGALAQGKAIETAEVRIQRRKTSIRRQTVQSVDSILGLMPRELGAVEGVLEMMSLHGSPHFAVRDVLLNRQIRCDIDKDDLDLYKRAHSAFGKRVAVLGVVRFKETGEPINVKAQQIKEYPSSTDLPTADEVYGILSRAE